MLSFICMIFVALSFAVGTFSTAMFLEDLLHHNKFTASSFIVSLASWSILLEIGELATKYNF